MRISGGNRSEMITPEAGEFVGRYFTVPARNHEVTPAASQYS